MDKLRNQIIHELSQGEDSINSYVFEISGYFFEKWLLTEVDECWPEEIRNADVTEEDAKEIAEAIVSFIVTSKNDELKSSAIWALGKTYSKEYLPIYLNFIKEYDTVNNVLLYQSLVAYDNAEGINLENISLSVFDASENRKVAKKIVEVVG